MYNFIALLSCLYVSQITVFYCCLLILWYCCHLWNDSFQNYAFFFSLLPLRSLGPGWCVCLLTLITVWCGLQETGPRWNTAGRVMLKWMMLRKVSAVTETVKGGSIWGVQAFRKSSTMNLVLMKMPSGPVASAQVYMPIFHIVLFLSSLLLLFTFTKIVLIF